MVSTGFGLGWTFKWSVWAKSKAGRRLHVHGKKLSLHGGWDGFGKSGLDLLQQASHGVYLHNGCISSGACFLGAGRRVPASKLNGSSIRMMATGVMVASAFCQLH
jgi:hypothetical protein